MQNKYSHLNQGQRHRILALERAGHSISFMADHLGVSKSTVSRELKRNAKKLGSYNAVCAQEIANETYNCRCIFSEEHIKYLKCLFCKILYLYC